MKYLSFLSICLLVLILFSGCQNKYKTVRFEGTVLFGDKPVPNVVVAFAPMDNGRPSLGYTDANGKFFLEYTREVKGLPPGEYKIAIRHSPQGPPTLPELTGILDKYSEQNTKLKHVVTNTEEDFKIVLEP